MADEFDPDAYLAQPPSVNVRAMSYGPIQGEYHRAAMVGPNQNRLQSFDIAASPDLEAAGYGQGDWVTVNGQLHRIADASYWAPGVPNRRAIELRDAPDLGRATVTPAPFNPDAYLGEKTAPAKATTQAITFDPDSYLGAKEPQPAPATTQQAAPSLADRVKQWIPDTLSTEEEVGAARQLSKEHPAIADIIRGADLPSVPRDVLENLTPLPGAYHQLHQAYDVLRGVPVEQAIPESQQFVGIEQKPLEERIKTGLNTAIQLAFAHEIGKQVIPQAEAPVITPGRTAADIEAAARAEPQITRPGMTTSPGTLAGDVSRALERRFTMQPTPPEGPPPEVPVQQQEPTLALQIVDQQQARRLAWERRVEADRRQQNINTMAEQLYNDALNEAKGPGPRDVAAESLLYRQKPVAQIATGDRDVLAAIDRAHQIATQRAEAAHGNLLPADRPARYIDYTAPPEVEEAPVPIQTASTADLIRQQQEPNLAQRVASQRTEMPALTTAEPEPGTEPVINAPSAIPKNKIDDLIPFNIQGNKTKLLAHSIGGMVEKAAETSNRTIDAFAGSGTYSHYIRELGLGKSGDILNEFDPLRAITHKQIRDNPAAVGAAVDRFRKELQSMITVKPGDLWGQPAELNRKAVSGYFRQKFAQFIKPGQNLAELTRSRAPVEMVDHPDLAGLYTLAQNQAFSFLPIQAELSPRNFGTLRQPGYGVVGKTEGRVQILKNYQPKTMNASAIINAAGQRFKGLDVRRGDGWKLIRDHAGEGDFVPVDTSYLNKGLEKTANYNEATKEDARPDVYLTKIRENLLPAWDRGAKLLITNNYDPLVAEQLRELGFQVHTAERSRAVSTSSKELIATNYDHATGAIFPRRDVILPIDAAAIRRSVERGGGEAVSTGRAERLASRPQIENAAVSRRAATITGPARLPGPQSASIADLIRQTQQPTLAEKITQGPKPAAAPAQPAAAAQPSIAAQVDALPTQDVITEAIRTVGKDEFKKRVQLSLEQRGITGQPPEGQQYPSELSHTPEGIALETEMTARDIVTESRQAAKPAAAPQPITAELPTEAAKPPVQAVSDQPHVSAVANRFTQERAARGEIGPIAPGEGVSTTDLVQKGLAMPPERAAEAVSRMMQGGDVALDDAAAIRGEEARLSQRSNDLSRTAQTNPADVNAQLAADNAFKDLTDFHNGPVAQLKRNFHGQGMALQGEIPVDLSTLNGLREAWLKDTGKPPPPAAEPMLRRTADKVARSVAEEKASGARLGAEVEKATRGRKLPTVEEVRQNIADRMKVEPCII